MTLLASKICGEIEISGAVSFARFMEMSLYTPDLGYYELQNQIGQRGDFYTSVSVGSLFGELLAFQFAEWFEESATRESKPEKMCLQIVEAGAHNGQLAFDILHRLREFRPQIFEKAKYFILEPSSKRRNWQQKTLVAFSEKIAWHNDFSEIPQTTIGHRHFTIIFSNELFDAMPIHRFGWDAKVKSWFEWGVGWGGNSFVWKRLAENQRSPVSFPQLDAALLAVLPDGFTTEISPAATNWWSDASSALVSGKLVAIDYGLLADEFLAPERHNGTARAYFQHHPNADLLACPGEQDITAHVNFSALREAGENAGLKTNVLISQTKFLTEIVGKVLSRSENICDWNEKRRKQFQTLTHPEHLGRSFRVLVQSRD